MDETILDHIPFKADIAGLTAKLHLDRKPTLIPALEQMAAQVESIANPKAFYKNSYVDSREEDQIVLDGISFKSKVLAVNLKDCHHVYPTLVTCGTEMDEWAHQYDGDLLSQYWADVLKEDALYTAYNFMQHHLEQRYQLPGFSSMSPGSLPDWPITEQTPLFQLFGEYQHTLGVRLTDSMLMVPNKTVSGIIFPTGESYVSCMLCPREKCVGRRAPYDAEKRKKYQI